MSSRDPLWVNCAAKDFCLAYQAPLWSRFESCRSLVLVLEDAVILSLFFEELKGGGAWYTGWYGWVPARTLCLGLLKLPLAEITISPF
jgi:hypothetical protein